MARIFSAGIFDLVLSCLEVLCTLAPFSELAPFSYQLKHLQKVYLLSEPHMIHEKGGNKTRTASGLMVVAAVYVASPFSGFVTMTFIVHSFFFPLQQQLGSPLLMRPLSDQLCIISFLGSHASPDKGPSLLAELLTPRKSSQSCL